MKLKCDRCNQLIDGNVEEIPSANIPCRCTEGYYDVSEGYWKTFARNNEKIICDNCMHSDLRYQMLHCQL